ncbi:MAG: hypothetical protein WC071_09925 [Victivallaceae bacterium]
MSDREIDAGCITRLYPDKNTMFDLGEVADFLSDYSINVLSRRDNKTRVQFNRTYIPQVLSSGTSIRCNQQDYAYE